MAIAGDKIVNARVEMRDHLKKKFPNIQFELDSRTYSYGCIIQIHWKSGPRVEEVSEFVESFRDHTIEEIGGYYPIYIFFNREETS